MGIVLLIIGIIELIFLLKLDKFTFEKYKKYKVIAFVYFLSIIVNYIFITNTNYIQQLKEIGKYTLVEKNIVMLVCMTVSLIYSSLCILIIQKVNEKKIIREVEKNIKVMEYEYYREILKNVSPAILAYSYNKNIDVEDAVVAILLNLQLKKYIKIENNKIIILKDTQNLLPHEKLVLEKIEYGKYDEDFFEQIFKDNLIRDMVSEGYIHKEKSDKNNIFYFMEMIIAWMIIYMLTTIPFFIFVFDIDPFVLCAIYFSIALCMPIYKFIQNKIIIIRTKEIIELGAKITGVKNYIEDYSNIKNSNIDIINLYDEFVVYAIILNIEGNLNDDCKKMYENTKNMMISLEDVKVEKEI